MSAGLLLPALCRVCRVACRVPCTRQTQQRRGLAPSVQGVQALTWARAGEYAMRKGCAYEGANSRARNKDYAHPARLKKDDKNQRLKACRVVQTLMHASLHTLHKGALGGLHG